MAQMSSDYGIGWVGSSRERDVFLVKHIELNNGCFSRDENTLTSDACYLPSSSTLFRFVQSFWCGLFWCRDSQTKQGVFPLLAQRPCSFVLKRQLPDFSTLTQPCFLNES